MVDKAINFYNISKTLRSKLYELICIVYTFYCYRRYDINLKIACNTKIVVLTSILITDRVVSCFHHQNVSSSSHLYMTHKLHRNVVI